MDNFGVMDFYHDYKGLYCLDKSRCHVRVIDKEKRPLVVICSALVGNMGVSIMNYAENLRKEVLGFLAPLEPNIKDQLKNFFLENPIDKIIKMVSKKIEKKGSLKEKAMLFGLNSFTLYFEYRRKYIQRQEKVKGLIWIEHYPVGTWSDADTDKFLLVDFENEKGPVWRDVNLSYISELTGIAENEIIPKIKFSV